MLEIDRRREEHRGREGLDERALRARQVEVVLGKASAPVAVDLLELVEFGWRDSVVGDRETEHHSRTYHHMAGR